MLFVGFPTQKDKIHPLSSLLPPSLEALIPVDGSPMPRHLRPELQTMLRRLFRVYAHAWLGAGERGGERECFFFSPISIFGFIFLVFFSGFFE